MLQSKKMETWGDICKRYVCIGDCWHDPRNGLEYHLVGMPSTLDWYGFRDATDLIHKIATGQAPFRAEYLKDLHPYWHPYLIRAVIYRKATQEDLDVPSENIRG
jgi:hypothetical protein